MDNFIPVEANINGKTVIWYMDISTLSLSDLIKLKEELNGTKINSFKFIDAIIHETIGYNKQDAKSIKRESKKTNRIYKKSKSLIKAKRRQGR